MQPDINQLFQQMQRMQKEVVKLQEELKNTQVEASSGGGAVTVKCDGEMNFHTIQINPEVVDPADTGMLEDLILLAVNEAIVKCQGLAQQGMGRSLGLITPGGKSPGGGTGGRSNTAGGANPAKGPANDPPGGPAGS